MRHIALIAVAAFATGAYAQELIYNPTFADLNTDGNYGDGWGSWGAAGFHNFFGASHASFFSDGNGNFGGVYQLGIGGTPGQMYQFDLLDVRLESNINANYQFGVEFYALDDSTKLGDTFVPISLSPTGDGLSFSMTATAPAGTVWARPVVSFDNAVSAGAGQENAFIFSVSMTAVPAPATLAALGGLAVLRRRRRR